LIYFSGKIPDFIWQSIALTIAAQILTTPVCIFNFHQFPTYFLPANLLAVPLSSLILVGELLLCSISFLPEVAHLLGILLTKLIWILNSYVGEISSLPFSTLGHLEISLPQILFIYSSIWGLAAWIIKHKRIGIFIGLTSVCSWLCIRTYSFLVSFQQERLVVYNITRRQALDCIRGSSFLFYGDIHLEENNTTKKYYLDPWRIKFRLKEEFHPKSIGNKLTVFAWSRKKLLILEDTVLADFCNSAIHFDVIVLSKNCSLSIAQINKIFGKTLLILDRSNSRMKLVEWKKDCEALSMTYYDLAEKGTFEMRMD
jgi:competence protein ComEC